MGLQPPVIQFVIYVTADEVLRESPGVCLETWLAESLRLKVMLQAQHIERVSSRQPSPER